MAVFKKMQTSFLPLRSANSKSGSLPPGEAFTSTTLITCNKHLEDLALYITQNKTKIKLNTFNCLLSS